MQVCYCFMSHEHAIKRKNLGQYKWDFQHLICKCKDPLSPILAVYTILFFLYVALLIPKNFVERFWSQRIWKHQIGATTSEVERGSFLTWRGINYLAACREKPGAGTLWAQCDVPLQIYGFSKICVEALAKPHAGRLTPRTLPWVQPLPGLCGWVKSWLHVTKPSTRHGVCMLNPSHVHVRHCFCSVPPSSRRRTAEHSHPGSPPQKTPLGFHCYPPNTK